MLLAMTTVLGMTGSDVVVIAGAVVAIAWVNWYFFFAASAGRTPGNAKRDPRP